MDNKYKPLFTSWKINNLEIKNRIVMTSMGGTNLLGWMEINHFDKAGAELIMQVAKNNVGLILVITHEYSWQNRLFFDIYSIYMYTIYREDACTLLIVF